MRILYIHQYFKTPEESAATRSYWISKELIKRGHQVVMITSSNPDKGGIKDVNGIEVHYIPNGYSNYMSKVKKVKSFAAFMYKAIREGSKQKNIDMVFATSTPLSIGAVALWLKKFKRMPYVFEVRDLWPEFPIQIGAVRNKYLIKLLRKFERSIYKNSEHVVALSPGMEEGVIAAGTPENKVSMVPNMSKPDCFYRHAKDDETAKKFGIDLSKFNVIHFGSMGVANGLEYVIDVATNLQDDNVDVIFMGAGATEPKLKQLVKERNLENVKFLGRHPMATVMEVVNCCDLSVVSFKDLPILATNSPNKLFDSLSAGIPIAVNSAGWTKDLVEKGDCGFYASVKDPKAFADKIREVKDNKELLDRWGKNARRLSETKYDKNILCPQIAEVIEKAANR